MLINDKKMGRVKRPMRICIYSVLFRRPVCLFDPSVDQHPVRDGCGIKCVQVCDCCRVEFRRDNAAFVDDVFNRLDDIFIGTVSSVRGSGRMEMMGIPR